MSSHVVAIVCWGLALAELMVPYSMKLLSLDMQSWLGLAMVGATTLSAGLFTCVFLLARRHGSRFSRPQASGYELACQDDLNQVWKKIVFKVHIFLEGHKILWNLHLTFDCVYCSQKLGEDFAKKLWPSQNIWTLLPSVKNIGSYSSFRTLFQPPFRWPMSSFSLEISWMFGLYWRARKSRDMQWNSQWNVSKRSLVSGCQFI